MSRSVKIIGMSMDLGQSRRGVDMGPSALRYAGLSEQLKALGHTVKDLGNIEIADKDILTADRDELLSAIISACEKAYELGRRCVSESSVPVFLGGDHSISIGTVGGITHDAPAGILWVDAHGDFNVPETSPNGNIHGMPVAVLLGKGYPGLVDLGRPGPKIKPQDIILFGTRNLDYDEKGMLRESGIRVYTMREIDERGLSTVAQEAMRQLSHLEHIHVSLDMDSLDPQVVPGVGTAVTGGLTYREAHLLMEIIADTEKVGSLDIVEINPVLDHLNQSATIAVELAVSLLGKRIL